VAHLFQAPRHPLTLRRGFEQNARFRPLAKKLRQPNSLRSNSLMEKLAILAEDANMAFHLPKVYANILHG
jgi:hypothetical protein